MTIATTPPRFRLDIFSCLSLYRKTGRHDFAWTLLLAALFGAFYGIFITPFWSEAVEFAQAWAGLMDYSHSPWSSSIFSAPSLQITLPALLLQAGVGIWPLCLAVSAVFCAIATTAVAATAYVFTRSITASLLVCLLLLSYKFANSHGYPVGYPVSYSQFGQTGNYVALLTLALAACARPRAAGITAGLLGGIHAVWCVGTGLAVLPVLLYQAPQQAKRFALCFALTLAATISLQLHSETLLRQNAHYPLPVLGKIIPVNPTTPLSTSTHRQTFEAHNVLFADAESPLLATITYLFPTLFLALLSALLLRLHRHTPIADPLWPAAPRLLLMAAIPITLALLFKIAEELSPSLIFLQWIDDRLPALTTRAIIGRWLNLASLLVPICTFALLLLFARDRHAKPALALIILMLLMATNRWSLIYIRFPYMNALLLLATITYFWRSIKTPVHTTDTPRILALACLSFFIFYSVKIPYQLVTQHRFLSTDAATPLTELAASDTGQLLVAPGVIAAQNGFNPQLRTGRPLLLPSTLPVTDPHTKKTIHVFCYTDPYLPFAQFYANVRPCFENRPAREWAVIAKALPASGILTPADWQLHLPKAATGGGFTYYRLP